MQYFHHLLPLYPPPTSEEIEKIGELLSINAQDNANRPFVIRLLGLRHDIYAIAISFTEDYNKNEQAIFTQTVANRMIAVLRMTYASDFDLCRNGPGFLSLLFISESSMPVFGAELTLLKRNAKTNFLNIRMVYEENNDEKRMTIIALFAESLVPQIPVHYRILSLFRALEYMHPGKNELNRIYNFYNEQFVSIGMSNQSLKNAAPRIRNRCAHGETTAGEVAFSSPAYLENQYLPKFMLLLQKIAADIFNKRYNARINVTEFI